MKNDRALCQYVRSRASRICLASVDCQLCATCFVAIVLLTPFVRDSIAQGPRVTTLPDEADVRYGSHERHVLDIWREKTVKAAPVVIYFHAGGFTGGDKRDLPQALLDACRQRGFSVVSANYRYSTHAPYPAPMLDGGRVIQFIRQQAEKWNLDTSRLVLSGRSAGAAMALWLAFHSDLAHQEAADPLERLSTRSAAVGVVGAQSTLDPREVAKLISPATARHPAFAQLFDIKMDDLFTDKAGDSYQEASAMTHLSTGDPPAFLFYSDSGGSIPDDAPAGAGVHHPAFGFALEKAMDELGLECHVKLGKDYNNDFVRMFEEMAEFFSRKTLKRLPRG